MAGETTQPASGTQQQCGKAVTETVGQYGEGERRGRCEDNHQTVKFGLGSFSPCKAKTS